MMVGCLYDNQLPWISLIVTEISERFSTKMYFVTSPEYLFYFFTHLLMNKVGESNITKSEMGYYNTAIILIQ